MNRRWLPLALSLSALGCAARSAYDVQRDNPLGVSFWVVPTPSEDTGLLGRTFVRAPDTALTLEEQSRPNPCENELHEASLVDMTNDYQNAIDVRSSARGQALLGLYGFSGDTASASHLLYKVKTSKKVTRLDTTAYVNCCAKQDCGWGYVSALVYGEGEYVSARDSSANGKASYQLVTAQGASSYTLLNRKGIHGWLAAIITAHDRREAAQACPPDQKWQAYECVGKTAIGQARDGCAQDDSQNPFWDDNPQMRYQLKTSHDDACRWLEQHQIQH